MMGIPMPEITISRVFHGPPLRIWSALIEPEHRQAWRPMIQLDDASQVGETQCTFAFPGWSRSVRSPAEVDHLDKPRAFAWSCGIPHVFMIEERFELQGDDGGTTVSHSCALRGLLAPDRRDGSASSARTDDRGRRPTCGLPSLARRTGGPRSRPAA
jgi:uncharacterized protein YndB with AHSA1/START domain